MQFSTLFTVIVAASLKEEFDAAKVTKGFGKWGILQQPFFSAKLQMDKLGSVRAFAKDLSRGNVVYTRMDFSASGLAIAQTVSEKEAGKAFKSTTSFNNIADPFIAAPVSDEPECDTAFFAQRLSHEGAAVQQKIDRDGSVVKRGAVIAVKNGQGDRLTNNAVDAADDDSVEVETTSGAGQILEVWKVARPSANHLCLTQMRRDPPKSRKSRVREGISVKEQCNTFEKASEKANLNKIQGNFAHSDEENKRRVKSQSVQMCFGEMCTLHNLVQKTVRIVRNDRKREGKTRNITVKGSYIYKYYSQNQNKAEVVEFDLLNKKCTEETPLLSLKDLEFSKCGDIVKAKIGGFIYLMQDTNGKLSEATNAPATFNPAEIAPVDTKANDDFAKGVQQTVLAAQTLVANNGVIPAAPLATSGARFISAVFVLLF